MTIPHTVDTLMPSPAIQDESKRAHTIAKWACITPCLMFLIHALVTAVVMYAELPRPYIQGIYIKIGLCLVASAIGMVMGGFARSKMTLHTPKHIKAHAMFAVWMNAFLFLFMMGIGISTHWKLSHH